MRSENDRIQASVKLPLPVPPSASNSMRELTSTFQSVVNHTHVLPLTKDGTLHEQEDDDMEWEEWDPSKISFLSHMLAGSMAGLAEHVALYPVDTIKTHLQCQRCGSSSQSSWSSTVRMIQREGVFRLWRGVSAMFAGCIPAHAAFFSIFEATKRLVGADKPGHHPFGAAFAGAAAALSHDMLITPFDVAKQRLQLGYYRNVRHCMSEMLRVEGVGAFYVSLPTTLLMNLPHGGVVVAVNESMRKLLNPGGKYDIFSSMIAGCTAGAVAAAVTTPMDVIKTRLQTHNMRPCGEESPDLCIKTVSKRYSSKAHTIVSEEVFIPKISGEVVVNKSGPATADVAVKEGAIWLRKNYQTVFDIAYKIAREEGVAGFYRGAVPRMLQQAPAVAISWTVYEGLKNLLGFASNRSL